MMGKYDDFNSWLIKHHEKRNSLYRRYLKTYLTVFARSSQVEKIYLYDIMGRDLNADNEFKISPVALLETIKDYFFSNFRICPPMELVLSSPVMSEYVDGVLNSHRIKTECESIFNHRNLKLKFADKDYSGLYPEIRYSISKLAEDERIIVLMDPYGFSGATTDQVSDLVIDHRADVLLYLPVTDIFHMLKVDVELDGWNNLKIFTDSFFRRDEVKNCKSDRALKDMIIVRLRRRLRERYADCFTLEDEQGSISCLFFLSGHTDSFEKLLYEKWFPEEAGLQDLKLNIKTSLFRSGDFRKYDSRLKKALKEKSMSNRDLYIYGLKNGFLPGHTGEVLENLQEDGLLEVKREDGKFVRKKAFYLKNTRVNALFNIKTESD